MHTVKKAPPPTRTLETWLTLEVLTPQPIPKPKDLETSFRQQVRLDKTPDPWTRPPRKVNSREKGHFWFVYIGEIDLNAVIGDLLNIFPNKGDGEFNTPQGEATLAVIVLDSTGRPVEDKSFLSSFAWGYGKVRTGDLKQLHRFVDEEELILEQFGKELIIQDEEGKIQPLDTQRISQLCDWLIHRLNIPEAHIKKPGIAIRVPIWKDKQEPPEPELLNSFFLEDLYRVKGEFADEKHIGKALQTYMNAKAEKDYQDVAKDDVLLKNTLRPSKFPLARWPVKGRYPLYLMQQAAVNHINVELQEQGLVAINGPPGTGKTTLLRDIVANVVFQRACLLADFDNPEKAFTHQGKMYTGSAFTHLYELDKSLKGFEIVVASNNNKAVENISKDIPGIDAVANDFDEPLRFFSTVADYGFASKEDRDKEYLPNICWGTAAAVLGNSANKKTFVNDFWWNKTYGMRAYLASVSKSRDEDSPKIAVLEDAPTTHQQALDNWLQAREAFLTQKQKIADKIAQLEKIYESLVIIDNISEKLNSVKQEFDCCTGEIEKIKNQHIEIKKAYNASVESEKTALILLQATKTLRPGFFARLFNTQPHKSWKSDFSKALAKVNTVSDEKKALEDKVTEVVSALDVTKRNLAQANKKYQSILQQYEAHQEKISQGKNLLGNNFPDVDFWRQPEIIKQKLSPWIESKLQQDRDMLFVLSFQLHRAFIDVAAKQFRNNLTVMMSVLNNNKLDAQYQSVTLSLWATLFMVVPVVSTTFASFSRLFSTMNREEIGWLLLDESGQATPQSAVGALWRSKRVVVIGDPLQVPPVVTIPNQLLKSIFDEYQVEVDDWAPPVMSVQTLADRICWLGSMMDMDDGEIWVGSPLRVHRRCMEPMFSVANKVAYCGLMISDTPNSSSIIGEVLGDSHWIDLESQSLSKWSQEEGKLALSLLHKLIDAQLVDPEVFIITPFRNIADQMKNVVARDETMRAVIGRDEIWKWVGERIGTVHTFQGKEAEAVIFILGATGDEHGDARAWAGSPPNILNVAVTRAKKRLYVIGCHKEWQNAGAFGVLSGRLGVKTIKQLHRPPSEL